MSKRSDRTDPDMRDEYDFSEGVRGQYVDRFEHGSSVVVLAPDVARVFKDADAVNDALRALAGIIERQERAKAG